MNTVQALIFDVQGTATDFRTTVGAAAREIAGDRAPDTDWGRFVDDWRGRYRPALDAILSGAQPWSSVDRIYRHALDQVIDAYGLSFLTSDEREHLNFAWQTIEPWPDTVDGLSRLKRRFKLATLSNADVSAVVNISKRGGLPWDAIFAAEMAGTFKPDPRTYRMALRYLGVDAGDAMMVACHKYDLHAARTLGMKTAFVARPLEFGPGGAVDTAFEDAFDINAHDLIDLAAQLGC
ncbi:haloacid dehalogenase type II [Burkholderia sp. Ac-20353]|uniref:haloacid dehalogenase type II n=1 Tax=Burkholderia sp. Ac-20353 TaxID=2703894 RepID=UPI001F11BE6F|nr:haloacid dehalogenase type II [Burkholderia sp. Ac-20353]MBN3786711.1 haloacid dehalogenase type II [Burkholderia sp. Ac-20353]